MKLRFVYIDSETSEADTVDFDANIAALHPNAGPIIAQSFSDTVPSNGDEPVVVIFESMVVSGDRATLTFRETAVLPNGQSYDILVTGLVYSNFK